MDITKFTDLLESLFFPWDVCCIVCNDEYVYRYGLCKKCFSSLLPVDEKRCPVCLDRTNTDGLCAACLEKKPDYERLYAPFVFEDALRSLVHGFKFGNKRYLRHPFAQMMRDALPKDFTADIIIPVPLAPERLNERRYNQSYLLAKEFSLLSGIPVNATVLQKRNGQKQMSLLNKKERRDNIKGFYYSADKLNGESVLLIDDICTTGETLRECARILKCAGVGKITCACVARTDIKESF